MEQLCRSFISIRAQWNDLLFAMEGSPTFSKCENTYNRIIDVYVYIDVYYLFTDIYTFLF